MVALVFVVNLAFAILGLGLCLWHAWGHKERVVLLATTTVYGVILEQLVILRFERYVYSVSDFLLTIGDVPVVIGFGWAAILYSGMAIAESLGLSARARPFFVGLFALHIDLAIDAIAIRVPFWSWTPPGVWFGVPLGNFMGWFLVATLFVAAWYGLRERVGHPVLLALMALGLAVAGLVFFLEIWEAVATSLSRKVVVLGGVLVMSLVIIARDWSVMVQASDGIFAFDPYARSMSPSEGGIFRHDGDSSDRLDWRLMTIPFLFHGSYLGYFLVLGMFGSTPVLVLVSLAMIGVSVMLHTQTPIRRAGQAV